MTDIPRLRPFARRGVAYYDELRSVLAEIGPQLKADAETAKKERGKITPADLCRWALKYTLNVKATTEALEDMRILPTGTYDRMRDCGFKPMAALREIMQERAVPTEYRADGWPLCPSCGEDELWSPLLPDPIDSKPPISAYIAAGLRCYRCNWSNDTAAARD